RSAVAAACTAEREGRSPGGTGRWPVVSGGPLGTPSRGASGEAAVPRTGLAERISRPFSRSRHSAARRMQRASGAFHPEALRAVKILVLCYEYPPIGGGGGSMAKSIAEPLVARGHEVRVPTAALGCSAQRETIGR